MLIKSLIVLLAVVAVSVLARPQITDVKTPANAALSFTAELLKSLGASLMKNFGASGDAQIDRDIKISGTALDIVGQALNRGADLENRASSSSAQ